MEPHQHAERLEQELRSTQADETEIRAERRRRMLCWLAETNSLAAEITAVWPDGVSAADAVAEQRR